MIMIFIDTPIALIFPEEKVDDPDDFCDKITGMFETRKPSVPVQTV